MKIMRILSLLLKSLLVILLLVAALTAALEASSRAAAAIFGNEFSPYVLFLPRRIGARFTDPSSGLRFEILSVGEEPGDNKVAIFRFAENGRKKLVIPSEVRTPSRSYRVAYVDSEVFRACESLEEIVIADGMTEINSTAFARCEPLKKAVISEGVKSIGDSAFRGCSSLETVEIPPGVTSIGEGAFSECRSLVSADMPDTVAHIGDRAFEGCSSLASAVIPEGVAFIGERTFYGCSSLADIAIPASVLKIGAEAFWDCPALERVDLPDGLASIEYGTFLNCKSLREITIPAGVASIGVNAFNGCFSLARADLPDGLVSIENQAFAYCRSLSEAAIPKSVASIGEGAFFGCSGLKSASIPAGVAYVGSAVFRGAESAVIYCEADGMPKGWDPEWNGGGARTYWNACADSLSEDEAGIRYVRAADGSGAIAVGYGGSSESLEIPRATAISGVPLDVTAIAGGAFDGAGPPVIAAIHSAVSRVGFHAFGGRTEFILCEASERPEGWDPEWNYGGARAFWNSGGDDYVQDENGLRYLKASGAGEATVIGYVGDAVTLTIPREIAIAGQSCKVAGIADFSFIDRKPLKTVTIPPGAKIDIAETFGYGYPLLTIYGEGELSFEGPPDECGDAPELAYWNIKGAELVQDERGVQYVATAGEAAVTRYVGSADSLEIPRSITVGGTSRKVTAIGHGAFFDCPELSRVFIPGSVRSVGESIFDNDVIAYCESNARPKGWVPAWNGGHPAYWNVTPSDVSMDGNGIEFVRTGGGRAAVARYRGGADSLAIPGETVIGGRALEVAAIGDRAFENCSSLSSVSIPESVKIIGAYAFSLCKSLDGLAIPKGVASVGDSAFRGCESLKSAEIPDGVKAIGEGVFASCRSLSHVRIPKGVTSIGDWAFSGCESLRAVEIPERVRTIGVGAFEGCRSLKALSIPNGVTSIGNWAFNGCGSLKAVGIPEGVRSIGESAFANCRSLSHVTIPKGVASIGDWAFSGCESLKSVEIPEGVRSIGTGAFADCRHLSVALIPKSVTRMDSAAFASCPSLTIFCEARAKPRGWASDWNPKARPVYWRVLGLARDEIGVFYVKTAGGGAAAVGYDGNASYLEIPGTAQIGGKEYDVTSVGDSAFSGKSWLRTIFVPEGVRSIGYSAFANCESVADIILPDGLESIGKYAFAGCPSLALVSIPESVKSMGEGAFYLCKSVTIRVAAESPPGGWNPRWNASGMPVEWGRR
jgi:hypothetical protein